MADKDMAAEFKLFLEWKAKRKEESKTDSVIVSEERRSKVTEQSEPIFDEGEQCMEEVADEQIVETEGGGDDEGLEEESKDPECIGECIPADDYLSKGKGRKRSEPSKVFHHILKTAAREAKVWGTGISLRGIKPPQLKYIHDRVIGECPSLKGHSREIDMALGKSLTNSNFYQRKIKRKLMINEVFSGEEVGGKELKGKGKGNSKGKGKMLQKRIPRKVPAKKGPKDASSSKSKDASMDGMFKEGDEVLILTRAGGDRVALGTFLSVISPGMYCRIRFGSHEENDPRDLDLPEPSGKKTQLCQLEKNDIFVWKLTKIEILSSKRTMKRNTKFDDYWQ